MKSIVAAGLVAVVQANEAWSYDDQEEWGWSYPECDGDHQSPVDLSESTFDGSLDPLEFHYNNATMQVSNIGHALKFSFPEESAGNSHLYGGSLMEGYVLAQFHFHWGTDATDGSEHMMHGRKYPAELHFVHYSDSFASMDDAAASGEHDAFAVVGVLFDIGEANPTLQAVLDAEFADIEIANSTNYIHVDIDPSSLLPSFEDFFFYNGSFTTPGCNEIVAWHVLSNTSTLSEEQLAQLIELDHAEGHPVGALYRDVQPLNGRVVTASFNATGSVYIEPLDDMGSKLEEATIIFFVFSALGCLGMYCAVSKAATAAKKAAVERAKQELRSKSYQQKV